MGCPKRTSGPRGEPSFVNEPIRLTKQKATEIGSPPRDCPPTLWLADGNTGNNPYNSTADQSLL
eukprot:scaffold31155_cov59-Phaeocystis_antarctica.AAC.1